MKFAIRAGRIAVHHSPIRNVLGRAPEPGRIVFELAQAHVAAAAELTAPFPVRVVMIVCEFADHGSLRADIAKIDCLALVGCLHAVCLHDLEDSTSRNIAKKRGNFANEPRPKLAAVAAVEASGAPPAGRECLKRGCT
jgi:hypothetical protein